MKNDRILIISDFFPYKNDKKGIIDSQLCSFLLKEKKSVYSVCINDCENKEVFDDEVLAEVEFKKFNNPNSTVELIDIINGVVDYIKEKEIDLVICHVNSQLLFTICEEIQNFLDKKVIIHLFNAIKDDYNNYKFLRRQLTVNRIKKLIKKSYGVLCSTSEKDYKKIKRINKNTCLLDNDENNIVNFFKTVGFKQLNTKNRILEVNYTDLPGKTFNGYDLMNYFNKETNYKCNQIVKYKRSDDKKVLKIYDNDALSLEYKIIDFEYNELSVHSCLSYFSDFLANNDLYKKCDLLHVHMIHNCKMPLISLVNICNEKPTIISIHDPWTFTGRCVHYEDCDKYLTGCVGCQKLDNLFPLKEDNCSYLWNVKKMVYDSIDVDYVVSSQYMLDLFKKSPLTKNKRVHLIPFGIDINLFSGVSKEEARKRYNISKDDIVLFHRAQRNFKGTDYLEEALKLLETKKNITIITCSEKNLLDSIKNKYNVIDLGDIGQDELRYAYNACDIYVMPSIGESFGFMAIEAMSCGKPVIVFNNTALPSVTFAPECGIAVENKNSKKLMEAIKLLVEDENERKRRGKLAKKIVKEHYDVNLYNKKMEELCDEVIERKHDFSKKKILDSKIKETKDVIYMKHKLNKLSSILFENNVLTDMLYEIKNTKIDKKYKIDYSDINVQLLINDYNKRVYNNFINKKGKE